MPSWKASLLCVGLTVVSQAIAESADTLKPWILSDYHGFEPKEGGGLYRRLINFNLTDPNLVFDALANYVMFSIDWDASVPPPYGQNFSILQFPQEERQWIVKLEPPLETPTEIPPKNSPVANFALGIWIIYPQDKGGQQYKAHIDLNVNNYITELENDPDENYFWLFGLKDKTVPIKPEVRS